MVLLSPTTYKVIVRPLPEPKDEFVASLQEQDECSAFFRSCGRQTCQLVLGSCCEPKKKHVLAAAFVFFPGKCSSHIWNVISPFTIYPDYTQFIKRCTLFSFSPSFILCKRSFKPNNS